ncbi:MAG: cation:proton antiporter [Myxococcota bacterium]
MASSLILLTLGLLLSLGFAAGHSAEKLGLPRVAIYVLVGVVFSESLLGGLLPGDPRAWDPVLVDASLGGIAFLIGGEVRPSRLKTLGRTFAGGLAGQTLGALLLVTGALWGWQALVSPPPDASVALVLAAIATATAPAATLAVIEQYRCSGPLTATLLYIVAVDDALAIVLFSLAVALAGGTGFQESMLQAGWEIAGSLIVGAALGGLLGWFGRRVRDVDLRLPAILGTVLLAVGLAGLIELSALLTCMVLGLVAKEIYGPEKTTQWLASLRHIQEVLFLILFTLAGTHFEPQVFSSAFGFILVYLVARTAGKFAGAWLGVRAAKGNALVRRYLGVSLLPQAGVSIGLALLALDVPDLEGSAELILNTVLGTTILFELTAPLLMRGALRRAGEIGTANEPPSSRPPPATASRDR